MTTDIIIMIALIELQILALAIIAHHARKHREDTIRTFTEQYRNMLTSIIKIWRTHKDLMQGIRDDQKREAVWRARRNTYANKKWRDE